MPNDRQNHIIKLLEERDFIALSELESMFPQYSSMTLRRDLKALERDGYLVLVRGGAKPARVVGMREPIYSARAVQNLEAKEHIARIAAEYVEPGRSIYLDSGTTMMSLARALPDQRISVITSGPNIAVELAQKMRPAISLVGGSLNRDNLSASGPAALEYVRSVNIDLAFLAASGFTSKTGFTCGNYAECELKRMVAKKARRVIILMDSSKLDRVLPYTFALTREADIVIIEKEPPDEIRKLALRGKTEWRWC